MFTFLLQGLGLGFSAGVQPGPFQTYLISESLSKGWRKAWIAACAPLVSDGPIVTLVLLVLNQVPDWFQQVLQIAGGVFVLYLPWGTFQRWRNFTPDVIQADQTGSKSLFQAAMMNALSPGPYLFWSLVLGPILVTAWRENPSDAFAMVLSFYSGMIGVNLTVVMVFGQAARFGNQVRRTMLGFSILLLAGFGIYQLWQGVFV